MSMKRNRNEKIIFSFIFVIVICGGFFSLNGHYSKIFSPLMPYEDNYEEKNKWDKATLFEKEDFTYSPSYAGALNDPISINSNEDLNNLKLQGIITGEGTEENPYILEDLVIDTDFSGPAILIENTDAYLILSNCTVINSGTNLDDAVDAGITIASCSNIKIMNCILDNNERTIGLYGSFNNTVINNEILNSNLYAISISGAHYNQILNNTLIDNENFAIDIYESSNNFISGNNITDNHGGIEMFLSNNNIFVENQISGSTEQGIYMPWSNENNFSRNLILGNKYGIYLSNADENIIYLNDIYGNQYDQAYESQDSTGNLWDNGQIGNYWGNDFINIYPDATNDGTVWDTPYEIGGMGPGIDHFPLVKSLYPIYESPIGSFPWLPLSILSITSIAIVIEIQHKKRERGHI